MRKTLNIPDSEVKRLQHEAVDAGMQFANYLVSKILGYRVGGKHTGNNFDVLRYRKKTYIYRCSMCDEDFDLYEDNLRAPYKCNKCLLLQQRGGSGPLEYDGNDGEAETESLVEVPKSYSNIKVKKTATVKTKKPPCECPAADKRVHLKGCKKA